MNNLVQKVSEYMQEHHMVEDGHDRILFDRIHDTNRKYLEFVSRFLRVPENTF